MYIVVSDVSCRTAGNDAYVEWFVMSVHGEPLGLRSSGRRANRVQQTAGSLVPGRKSRLCSRNADRVWRMTCRSTSTDSRTARPVGYRNTDVGDACDGSLASSVT